MSNLAQKKIKFTSNVFEVFTQVQKLITPHQTHIFQLVKYFKEDHQLFSYAFEQAYLKIWKSFHKTNKKIPTKFQTLAQQFFENVLPLEKHISQLESYERELTFLNDFLELCAEGVFSTLMNIRIMCSRLLFVLIKLIPPKKLQYFLTKNVIERTYISTLHLIRTKISTYRQLGIKISSLILHLQEDDNLIEKELLKIMSVEDNEQIRKMVITNLTITKQNLDSILIRLRDKNPEIRSIVIKKLQGQHFNLHEMTINQIYKLLYDGYGSKELIVKRECVRYFAMFFTSESIQNQNRHKQFISIFRPNILLLNPHLYSLFNELIGDLLEEIQNKMVNYIKSLCIDLKNNNLNQEIIWLKNAINSQSKQIIRVYEQFGPTGIQLSRVLQDLSKRKQIFSISEILQLFAFQKMPEEIGRNKMFDALTKYMSEIQFIEVIPNYDSFTNSDICHIQTEDELERKKLLLSYYDMPIISSSFDLIFQIGQAMKNLRPEHYQMQIKQLMAEWHNPEENTKKKQKQLLQANMKEMEGKDSGMMKVLQQKYNKIMNVLEHEKQKTRKVLICISRLRHNCNLQSYLSIIKDQLAKQNKSNGLVLLGLYCLQNTQKVQIFWQIYWDFLNAQPTDSNSKNHTLVSIKVVTDFIVKFNTLSQPSFEPKGVESFNSDIFMETMTKLILSSDADIRILAIQSLCRMIYHERIDQNNLYSYFLYLLLLWLETSNEQITSRSVHTVSIFMKSYMEKGNMWISKLSQIFCIFFKVLLKFQEDGKGINKSIIKYNLTTQEFIRKTIFMVLTVLKYKKETSQNLWKYPQDRNQIGPQEFLIIFLLTEEALTSFIGKALNLCDFYDSCSTQVLIIVKKIIEEVNNTKKFKGFEQVFKRFEEQIEINLTSGDKEVFREADVMDMERQNEEKVKLLMDEARRIHKNLQEKNIFIQVDSDEDNDSEDSDEDYESNSYARDNQQVSDNVIKKRPPHVIDLDGESQQNEGSQSNNYVSRLRRKKRR